MLIQAHASGDAVHDDADGVDFALVHHPAAPLGQRLGGALRHARPEVKAEHPARQSAAFPPIPDASARRRRPDRNNKSCAAAVVPMLVS